MHNLKFVVYIATIFFVSLFIFRLLSNDLGCNPINPE